MDNALTPVAGRLTGLERSNLGTKAVSQLGFWAALLSTLLGIGYGLAVIIMAASQSKTGSAAGWTDIEAYLATFSPILMLPLVPSLLLAPAFTALMVCIHAYAAPEKRIWSQLGLAYTLIYAGMAFTNYIVQLVSVQRSLLAGETDGLAMLVHGNPHSIFWSLVSAYIFMNLAMLFVAPVFQGGRLETWIRRFFLLNGCSVVLTIATLWLDSPAGFLLGSLVIWCPIFSIATALLVVLFSRMGSSGTGEKNERA
jgi:hypothetical protein